jgi:hypothetical protein
MGVDALDICFRLEKSFGIRKIKSSDFDRLFEGGKADFSAGELHEWVMMICREAHVKVPPSSWHRVQFVLARALGKSPKIIRRETLVIRDLGMG